mmetsp:Transcript_6565/g.16605  ORF Transcript_6565/g.16605 Transcript_6565/m.16605 type:complete len:104 (-) Transcript_6565:3977-4288(-)
MNPNESNNNRFDTQDRHSVTPGCLEVESQPTLYMPVMNATGSKGMVQSTTITISDTVACTAYNPLRLQYLILWLVQMTFQVGYLRPCVVFFCRQKFDYESLRR